MRELKNLKHFIRISKSFKKVQPASKYYLLWDWFVVYYKNFPVPSFHSEYAPWLCTLTSTTCVFQDRKQRKTQLGSSICKKNDHEVLSEVKEKWLFACFGDSLQSCTSSWLGEEIRAACHWKNFTKFWGHNFTPRPPCFRFPHAGGEAAYNVKFFIWEASTGQPAPTTHSLLPFPGKYYCEAAFPYREKGGSLPLPTL